MRSWIAPLVTAMLYVVPLSVMAEDAIPPSPIVKTQLLINAPSLKKDVAVDAAVRFTMPPHWHIYWKNPGDSGIPTSFAWTLPEGLSVSEIAWPAPERIEISGLVNYGYSNEVVLPVSLIPTRDSLGGDVAVKASWLVCKEICIPESANLTGTLKADADAAKVIAAAHALAPQPFTGTANFVTAADTVTLTLTQTNPWGNLTAIRFSPIEDGLIANNPAGSSKQVGNELTLTLPRGSGDAITTWHGVLHLTAGGTETAWDITAHTVAGSQSPPLANNTPVAASLPSAPTALLTALALAFLGGLILNVMPCVLPILALKALALAKKAQASRTAAMKQGISYTAGVVASFLLIAGGMLVLKASGAAIGWGFQLQHAGFVAFLAAIMLLVSANLLGLFTLPVMFGARATGVNEERLSGSFFTGVIAVLVATPCTAPFMATAIGATLAFPAGQALAVFAALGLGMASPFLLISLWPAARRLLPKPGAWMHRFKQLLAIPMLATAAWLIFVLLQLVSPTPMMPGHEAYTPARLETLRAEGTPVLVDATAAWCLSCKVNERVALRPAEMQQFFREQNVTIMVADWTASDPEITAYLASFGRNGVPLYVYYPPHGTPIVLPQILTPSIVKSAIAP